MLRQVVHAHAAILKSGGFMVVNIADILCFQDENLPKIQLSNPSKHKVTLSKDEILNVKEKKLHGIATNWQNILGAVSRQLTGD